MIYLCWFSLFLFVVLVGGGGGGLKRHRNQLTFLKRGRFVLGVPWLQMGFEVKGW